MVTFTPVDLLIIFLFFLSVLLVGYFAGRKDQYSADDYLLSGRKVSLTLFILTNVATWYGGILGVGEFTYRYGLLAWFTQGLPYYIFALLFALFFAKKIRLASLFTIPDKISQIYGEKAGLLSAALVFILVSPAPYVLMTGNLISLIFGTGMLVSLIIAVILSVAYLFKGGFRSDVYTDVIQFFIMFAGFILIIIIAWSRFGGLDFLSGSLPETYLKFTGGASPVFIIVWFLIALWTFADPGFHQRCYAAKDGSTARKGIIISIFLWILFDFLTTSTGLYAKALLPDLKRPVLAYPMLAEKILSSGLKGFFYAALFATIMSTSNSFLFLSATTIGRDFIFRIRKFRDEKRLKSYTVYGLVLSAVVSVILAWLIPSVIEIWYTVGSFCIPGIILPVISSYYNKIKINHKILLIEMISAVSISITWYFIRNDFTGTILFEMEPMLAGLFAAVLIHCYGLIKSF
ncbi:MAG TPA: sodium:solute symporter family protein [Ignavibacteriaceae bacterium]|nr:sodium:solute symporter family protein [Ignavibacteriaceae bacterium]